MNLGGYFVNQLYMKFVIIFLIIVAVALSGCGTPADHDEAPPSGESMVAPDMETLAIYRSTCISCHAADFSGRVGEKSDLRQVGARLNKEQIANVIRNGGQMMPAQNLSEEEIEIISSWLSTLK